MWANSWIANSVAMALVAACLESERTCLSVKWLVQVRSSGSGETSMSIGFSMSWVGSSRERASSKGIAGIDPWTRRSMLNGSKGPTQKILSPGNLDVTCRIRAEREWGNTTLLNLLWIGVTNNGPT